MTSCRSRHAFLPTRHLHHVGHVFLRIQAADSQLNPMLEMLSLSKNIVDIGAFLMNSLGLRVLRVTFQGVIGSVMLEESFTALDLVVALGLIVSFLRIELNLYNWGHIAKGAQFMSFLHVAARVSPQKLILVNNFNEYFIVELPCFPPTTSTEIWLCSVYITQVSEDVFLALERLSLQRYRCTILDLPTMVDRYPCAQGER